MNNSSAFPPTEEWFSLGDTKYDYERIPQTAAYCLLFLASLVENCFLVWVIYKDPRLRSTTNFMVANMAVSDLVATIFIFPWNVTDINFGSRWFVPKDIGLALCKLVPFCGDTSIGVSLYSCVFIAIDRYSAVARPLQGGFGRTRLKYIIPGIWVVSGIIASPTLYYTSIVTDIQGDAYCRLAQEEPSLYKKHFYTMNVLHFGLSLPTISVLYVLIVYKLRHHKIPGYQTDLVRKKRNQQNAKILKMSVSIVVLSCLTWLLYSIFFVLLEEGKFDNLNRVLVYNLSFAVMFIAHTSFTYNFVICMIFIDDYRANLMAIVKKVRQCNRHPTGRDQLPIQEL